jgi:alpha-beta hydrolase superfamily lysophospholipase
MPETPRTIVLIHGLWMTPRSWEHWAARYESQGYKVIAPAWPGLEVEVEALNADPSPLAGLDVTKTVDHLERVIRELDNPPIIMGHSMGGMLTQLLLDRGLGAAGVGVSAATVKGVRDLPLSTLKASWHVLGNPFNRGKAIPLNAKRFHYAFANTLSREESDKLHQRYAVPAASTVLFQVAFSNLSRKSPVTVNFANDQRAPMLFIGFGEDHVVPPKATRHNAEKYKSRSLTEFKEYPGRPHFPGAPGWEEVADDALAWAVEHAEAAAPAAAPASTVRT